MRVFILRAIKEGIFTDFFCQQEKKEQAAVDALFDEIFLDEFLSCDEDLISKNNFQRVVAIKLHDDPQLQRQLISQFDTVDKPGAGSISEAQVKEALRRILRHQVDKLTDMDSDDDNEHDNMIGGLQMYREGAYAKDTISQILESFKGSTVLGDDETFI